MNFQEIISFFQDNWAELGTAVLAILGAVAVIVRLTPTESDNKFFDKWLGPVVRQLEKVVVKPTNRSGP